MFKNYSYVYCNPTAVNIFKEQLKQQGQSICNNFDTKIMMNLKADILLQLLSMIYFPHDINYNLEGNNGKGVITVNGLPPNQFENYITETQQPVYLLTTVP